MRKTAPATLVALVSIGALLNASAGVAQATSPCDEVTARNVGALFYTLNPIKELSQPEELTAFVQKNSKLLTAGGPTVRCVRLVGNRLMQHGLAAHLQTDRNRAYESALNMGADMDQARQVSNSIHSGGVDAIAIGQELVWLADVVPAAASGNWELFVNTGTQSRLSVRQIWPLYQQMRVMDPSMGTILEQSMNQMQPWVEYQVAVLAYWAGK